MKFAGSHKLDGVGPSGKLANLHYSRKGSSHYLRRCGGRNPGDRWFGSWKAQLKGKDEYELARRLLRAAFAVRESIQPVRNPFGLVGDAEVVAQSGPGGEKRSFLDVQTARMQIVYSALSNLNVEVLEAKVLWGEDVIDPRIMALRQCISTLDAKIWLLKSEEEQPSRHVTEVLDADLAEARVVTHLYLNDESFEKTADQKLRTHPPLNFAAQVRTQSFFNFSHSL